MANQGRSSLVWFALATVVFLLVAGCNGFWVNPTLTSIALSSNLGPTPTITAETGAPPTCPAGSVCTVQMLATGTFNDGSTGPITAFWSTSDKTIAAVDSSTGLVTGVAAGTATITASSGTISGQASVMVSLTGLQSIALNPAGTQTFSLSTGSVQFHATGTFAGGGTQDITDAVTWNSSDTTIATVSNSGSTSVPCATGSPASGGKGSVTFVKAGGPINITATSGLTTSPATALTIH